MITSSLIDFTTWLTGTRLTAAVAGHFWVVPTLQTIHILSVAVVLAGVVLINLRIVGVVEQQQPVSALLDRFLQPIGIALIVLAVTGMLLIAGEPTRALFRIVFWVKMALILVASFLTWSHRWAFYRENGQAATATTLRKGVAITVLLLWLAVIVAGRWIAYVEA